MAHARYDDVADFYEAGWTDSYADSVSTALFDLLGPVSGQHLLDVACGHGRITRELARRGATVDGLDLSEALIEKAVAAEHEQRLGIRYHHGDIATASPLGTGTFDAIVCSFGLSDIDKLDLALDAISNTMRANGRFVFSILRPCFPAEPTSRAPGRRAAATTTNDGGQPTARHHHCDVRSARTTGCCPPTSTPCAVTASGSTQ